jgi:hypothetical protein
MIGRKVCLWLSGPIATVIAVAETAPGPVYTVQFADGSTTRWAARHAMEPELHPDAGLPEQRIGTRPEERLPASVAAPPAPADHTRASGQPSALGWVPSPPRLNRSTGTKITTTIAVIAARSSLPPPAVPGAA